MLEIPKSDNALVRIPSLAQSTTSTGTGKKAPGSAPPSAIVFDGGPPLDLAKCLPQLTRESIALPDGFTAAMFTPPDARIDGKNEDSFTLDAFESLVQAARSAGKAFVIARVMTVDPGDATKCYYSYYAAHHINKVLFKTQPEQGLLHRMRCRNPLNNMVIVGEVHYFAVAAAEVDRAVRDWETQTGRKVVVEMSAGGDRRLRFNLSSTSLAGAATPDGPEAPAPDAPQQQPNRPSGAQPVQATQPALPSIDYHAKYVGSDDDFLFKQEFREFMRANALCDADNELFPLFPANMPPGLAVVGPDGQALRPGQPQPTQVTAVRGQAYLCGMLYWPPRPSLFFSKGGIISTTCYFSIVIGTIILTVVGAIMFLSGPLIYILPVLAAIGLIALFPTFVAKHD